MIRVDNELFNNKKSPVIELHDDLFTKKEIRLFVKRDDLIEPAPSGNKWRKLKYNLVQAKQEGYEKLLTFGGAFSNHIYAVAEAGRRFGFQTIGVIRGERIQPLNPTLQHAENCGMHLLFVDRSTYRLKKDKAFQDQLSQRFGKIYLLPEGGTNQLALQGCSEIVAEVRAQLPDMNINYWLTACGTGGTFAGLVQGLESDEKAIGISVLKGDFMAGEVQQLLDISQHKPQAAWEINTTFHHGGYAKHNPALIEFINTFKTKFDIPLDPIYNGKLFYAIWKMIEADQFPKESHLLAVHTGGLQGITGFNERFGGVLV